MYNLEDCPACRTGVGIMTHEGGWCAYVECSDCGAHTAHFAYDNEKEMEEAEAKAANLWNMGKVVRINPGD